MINPVNQISIQGYYIGQKKISSNQTYCCNTMELSGYTAGQAILARNNICFRKHERIVPKSFSCNLKAVDEPIPPYISVEIINNSNMPVKPGLKGLYLMLLNDEIFADKNNKTANFLASEIGINHRGLILSCSAGDVSKVLKMIDSDFINIDISDDKIKNIKQFAAVWLFLSRKTDDFKNEFDDIPAGMSEESYEKLISEITKEDIQKLHADIIKNSDININVLMNKNDYKNHKNEITNYIERPEY